MKFFFIVIILFSLPLAAIEKTVSKENIKFKKELTESIGYSFIDLDSFIDGVDAYANHEWSAAINFFSSYSKKDIVLKPYSDFLKAKSLHQKGKQKQSLAVINSLLEDKGLKLPKSFAREIEFLKTAVLIDLRKWKEAKPLLQSLERKWRYRQKYPDVLWRLLKVDLLSLKRKSSCRWARKLYSKYPFSPLVADWSLNLSKARVVGKILNCKASDSEKKKRVKSLQWSGQSKRAYQEIIEYQKEKSSEDSFEKRQLLFEYWVQEGDLQKVIHQLVPYFNAEKDNYSYMMLLGKAASRYGSLETALEAYDRAAEIRKNKRSKKAKSEGTEAFFHSAYASYQLSRYQEAKKRWGLFLKEIKKGYRYNESRWYVVWMDFLMGHYLEAAIGFETLQDDIDKNKVKFSAEQVRYWRARSYYELKNYEKALSIFGEMSGNKFLTYYGLLSTEYELKIKSKKPKLYKSFMAQKKAEEKNSSAKKLSFKIWEPQFTGDNLVHYQRYRVFKILSLLDWAKLELDQVKVSSKNREKLYWKLSAYKDIKSVSKSSIMAQLGFANEREEYGIEGSKDLWETAYPMPYLRSIKKSTSTFNVLPEFVYSIMKAESRYDPSVTSPVGAMGLLQIMPFTGVHLSKLVGEASFNSTNLYKPEYNILLGTRYLKRLLDKFDNSWPLAAASYNGGPHRVSMWLYTFGNLKMDEFIEHIAFRETRKYTKKVMRYMAIYNQLYKNEKGFLNFLTKPIGVKVPSKPPLKEIWETN